MNSKPVRSLLVLAVGAAHAWATPSAFVEAQFGKVPVPAVLEIRGALATNVFAMLGHAYPHPRVEYWRSEGRTAWILEGRGKSAVFTAGFVLVQGRIAWSEVLSYRGHRGREIRAHRFQRQFEGATLLENRELDRRIEGMTGATISSHAMQDLARLALYLESQTHETDKKSLFGLGGHPPPGNGLNKDFHRGNDGQPG